MLEAPEKLEDVTPENLAQWEKDAIAMDGRVGVVTICCGYCGKISMSNYVPLRKAWMLLEEKP